MAGFYCDSQYSVTLPKNGRVGLLFGENCEK